ncbi:hypothetical protein [Janthinobacterium fluminis]|uniref:Uncharacterized protein n=1 Tax=Janthinobacterium fluminis TaxID=2987524 RepID=A0ABT5K6U2_9BURK|nr:hypothetical protein [Janthinobacterium fluminis]MDC8760713.1 hypothetical protein [Janthinobacterium fluminis]
MQQQRRAQGQGQAGNLRAETVQCAAEPEAAEVGVAQQRIAAEFSAAVQAEGGVDKVLYIKE